MHKLHRLFPVRVFENDECLMVFIFQLKGDIRVDPIFWPSHTFPFHKFMRFGIDHFHLAKTEINNAALFWVTGSLSNPPVTKSSDGGKSFINFFWCVFDTNSVKNIRHGNSLSSMPFPYAEVMALMYVV